MWFEFPLGWPFRDESWLPRNVGEAPADVRRRVASHRGISRNIEDGFSKIPADATVSDEMVIYPGRIHLTHKSDV